MSEKKSKLKLLFTSNDIEARITEIANMSPKQKSSFLEAFNHELISDAQTLMNKAELIYLNYQKKDEHSTLLNLQTDNLALSAEILCSKLRFITYKLITLPKEEIFAHDFSDLSLDIVNKIDKLTQMYPLANTFLKYFNSKKKTQIDDTIASIIKNTDTFLELLVYTYNKEFSPSFSTDKYLLKGDFRFLKSTYDRDTASSFYINTIKCQDIVAKKDIIRNVILPIVRNANEHGLNQENDIYNRLPKSDKSSFYINIYTKIDEDKKEITLSVEDNGFGIRPEILDSLFEKGATTRQNKKGHGIGLWAVKNFVESQGGRIWAETELGKGTKFSFTITYKEKKDGYYSQ
ncbi:MAG: ATP-binding protein [Candidatus Nanoarchaeia archaeon]